MLYGYMPLLYGGRSPTCFHVFKQSFFGVNGAGFAKADSVERNTTGAPVEYDGVLATFDIY